MMESGEAKHIIEALLFVFSQPLALKRIADTLPDLDATAIRRVIAALNEEYRGASHAFQIQEVAGGYLLMTDQSLAPWVKRALQSPKPDLVSAAAMETLAIVAYRQPITKAEIEAIRGVDVTASLDTLIERRFVRVAGRKESSGRPFLYGTTTEFLRHFGLKSLEALPKMELPALKELGEASPAAPPPVAPASTASAAQGASGAMTGTSPAIPAGLHGS